MQVHFLPTLDFVHFACIKFCYFVCDNNFSTITMYLLQLAEISIDAATCLGMAMWEWCCVITATLYVYFVDKCHPYILLISTKSFSLVIRGLQ